MSSDNSAQINEKEAEEELEQLIIQTYNVIYERIKKEEEELARIEAEKRKAAGITDIFA